MAIGYFPDQLAFEGSSCPVFSDILILVAFR
jgi:hypothetical protein